MNFLYKPWSSLLTLLMLFFIAQHTQRHFWLGCIWSYTEIHKFFFFFLKFFFLFVSLLQYKDLQRGRENPYCLPYPPKPGASTTSSASRTTGQHFLAMLESVGQLHRSAPALHAMRGLFQVSVGLLYSFSPYQAPGSLTPRLAKG